MSFIHMLLVAFGLAADAFAVSVAEGIVAERLTRRHTLRVALTFGLFQGIMPVIGWVAGRSLRGVMGGADHWVAFGLLGLIGVKMIVDSLTGAESGEPSNGSGPFRLLTLGVATSLDALVVGVTLAIMGNGVWAPAVVIGAVTAVLCAVGVRVGNRVGTRFGRRVEILGGLILVALAVKILLEHLL